MGKSAMIIINPSSGKEEAKNYESEIKETIKREYPNIVVKYTEGEGDARKFAENASLDNFDLVVALGGDGTINETANGLANFKNPPLLGIIPMGTVNDLARALNIPMEAEKAIDLLVNGVKKKIDIGLVNNQYFTNMLGVGNLAKAIDEVDSEEKTKLGPLAYVKSIAQEIMKDDIFSVELQMDQENWEGQVSIIIISLIDSLGGFKSILSEVELGDGIFHIFAIKELDLAKIINMTPSLIMGKIKESDNIKYFKSKSLKIKAIHGNNYNSDIDGEKGPKLPLELKVLPRHLAVISGLEE